MLPEFVMSVGDLIDGNNGVKTVDMAQEKWDEASESFNAVINKYRFSQYWDPKGWYWKPAEISKINLEKIATAEAQRKAEGAEKISAPTAYDSAVSLVVSIPHLYEPGGEKIVNYEKYTQLLCFSLTSCEFYIKCGFIYLYIKFQKLGKKINKSNRY